MPAEPVDGSADVVRSGIGWIHEAEVRSLGPGAVAHVASERLDGQGLEGFWVHVDVDVLPTAEMPAVDSPQPGGRASKNSKR